MAAYRRIDISAVGTWRYELSESTVDFDGHIMKHCKWNIKNIENVGVIFGSR